MSKFFSTLKERVFELKDFYTEENYKIRGIWVIDFKCRPSPEERAFENYILVAQTRGQGSCFTRTVPRGDPTQLVGKYAVEHISSPDPVSIALLDSIHPEPKKHDEKIHLSGDPKEKSRTRANIVSNEVDSLLEDDASSNILMIGVVRNILRKIYNKGHNVKASDFDNAEIGRECCGTVIRHGDNNEEFIRSSDAAVVTGMTLQTETLGNIMDWCRKYNTKLVVFAQTGANLAIEYIEFGADIVVREPFPVYDFHGGSNIYINRN